MHNEFDGDLREAKLSQIILEKLPAHMVISLFKINLISHITFLLLAFMHRVNKFLKNNCIITSTNREEASLERGNNVVKERPLAVD